MHSPSHSDVALHRVGVLTERSDGTIADSSITTRDFAPTELNVSKSWRREWQPWLNVYASFLIFVNIWGFTFIFGIFESFYSLTYIPSESPSSLAWIGTIQTALLVIIGILAGPLFDLGAFRMMLIAGSFLVLLGLFMLSLSTAYYQIFLSQGVCVGIGGGLLYVPSLALVSKSFQRHRTIAMGIVTCGVGLGGVIYTSAFQSLLPKLGFHWTVRVLGFIATGVFAISVPVLAFPVSRSPNHSGTVRKLFDSAALHDGPFVIFSITSFFIFLGYLVPFFYIPSFGQVVVHTSARLSFWALAVSSATSILGRLVAAFAAQKVGVMLPWVSFVGISGVLCLIWTTITSTPAFFTFCALYGFFTGAIVALPPAIFPRICRDPSLLGTWMGMGWLMSGIAFLIGAPIAGALILVDGKSSAGGYNFLAVQLWSGLLLLVGSVGLCGLWTALVKLRGEKAWI